MRRKRTMICAHRLIPEYARLERLLRVDGVDHLHFYLVHYVVIRIHINVFYNRFCLTSVK